LLDAHVAALSAELAGRGGLGGIALTHDHIDHAQAVPAIRERFPGAPLGGGRGAVDATLSEGSAFGPLEVVATPGHAPDHLAFVTREPVTGEAGAPASAADAGAVAFTGDAVLGEGSVFITPYPSALTAYLDGLERLRRRQLALLLPGHGPPVSAPADKLDDYIAHRRERERRVLDALAAGKRTVRELLDDAWADAPELLRPAAAWTLAAHLDKLASEGRLPEGVERPDVSLLRSAGDGH
jgi:glyoxylase-like metal-dependent hydrolase (beta-lactamase superfamily II)